MQYLDAVSKMTESSQFVSKKTIQVYALSSNAVEAEIEWFYEDQHDVLELTPKKEISFSSLGTRMQK